MGQDCRMALVSVAVSSWEDDLSVYIVVARNMYHGSCKP